MARIQRKVPAASRRQSSSPQVEGAVRTRRKVPLKHLVRFTRMLATLTEAGLPILRNLRVLADQWPPGKFQDAVTDTADLVEEGQPLSDALAQNPDVFDDLYVNMARAGEAGGVLDKVMSRLADFQERSQEMRDRTRSALAYPIVIGVVAMGVVVALMVLVIPKFSELYTEMGMTLPGITQAMIATSQFMVKWWYLVLGLPFMAFIGWQMAYLRSYGFRFWNHEMHLRLPVIGGLVEQSQISRFANTFGTLVSSGVPHLKAFEIVRGALTSEVYREAVDQVREEVREGESIASSLESTGHFDDVVVSMVEVGEETGELDRMCLRVGEGYEENYKRALDIALKLLEPAMLILMAGIVGSIALALFLPLFKLLEEFGQAA